MCTFTKSVLLLVLFFANLNYSLAEPFLPLFLESRGVGSTWIGFIFSIFAVASTLTSLLIGKVVDRVGHGKVIISSIFLCAVSVFGFGFINQLESNVNIILIASLLRVGSGKCG